MIASRRAARAAWPSAKTPSLSGPRWTSFALIAASRSGSAGPFEETIPQIPHMRVSLVVASDQAPEGLARDSDRRRGERAQVEGDRAVGDPLEVVSELLGHRGLVPAAHLGKAGQPGANDEPLPVGRKFGGQLLEETWADRARPNEAHVATEHVPELRELVELCRAQPSPEPRRLGPRPLDQLGAEVGAEPLLGAAAKGAELKHVEDATVAADALPSVEERRPAGEQERQPDHQEQREGEQQHERRERDVEDAKLEIDPALRRAADEDGEPLDEGVARPRLRSGHTEMLEPRHVRVPAPPWRCDLLGHPNPPPTEILSSKSA